MRRRVNNRESQRLRRGAGFLCIASFLNKGNNNYRGRVNNNQHKLNIETTLTNDFKREIEALSSLLVAFFPSERGKIEEAKERARDSEGFLRLLARESPIMRGFILKQWSEKDEPLITGGGGEDGRC
jgi:hypothetical protein